MKRTKSTLCLLAALLFVFASFTTFAGFKVNAAAINEGVAMVAAGKAKIEPLDAAADLDKAISVLEKMSFVHPVYGKDTNINAFMEQKLKDKNVDGVKVSFTAADIKATTYQTQNYAKIDPATGDITYLFLDPTENAPAANQHLCVYNIFFTVSKAGQSKKASKKVTVRVHWDEQRVKDELLQKQGVDKFDLAAQIAPNAVDDVTTAFKLPNHIDGKLWFSVTWTSSDPSVLKIGSKKSEPGDYMGKKDYFPVTVIKPATTKKVTLTAKYNFDRIEYGFPEIYVEKTYELTVKGDPNNTSVIDEMNADLEKIWKVENLKYFADAHKNEAVDKDNLLYDLKLLTTRDMKKIVPDFYNRYENTHVTFYSCAPEMNMTDPKDAGMKVDGYRTYVRRPHYGEAAKKVKLKLTLTSKKQPGLTASREIEFTINPITHDEFMKIVNRKARLMEITKANLFDILNGNPRNASNKNVDKDHITASLSKFYEVFFTDEADLNNEKYTVAYDFNSKKDRGISIKSVDLNGDGNPDYFINSSRPDIIDKDSLNFMGQPQYDTQIKLSMRLNADGMEAYKVYLDSQNSSFSDEDKAKLASLFDQDVELEVKAPGKNGPAPSTVIKGKFVLVGSKTNFKKGENPYQVWLKTDFKIDQPMNAMELTKKVLVDNDYTCEFAGGFLMKITPSAASGLPELEGGKTNGSKSTWMWNLNGKMAPVLANAHIVKNNDEILWYFTNDWEEDYTGDPSTYKPKSDKVIKPNPNAKRPSLAAWWPGFAGDAQNPNAAKVLNMAIDFPKVKQIYAKALRSKPNAWSEGSFSDPLHIDGKTYVAFSDAIHVYDEQGNEVMKAELNRKIDYTCRLAYADGLILVQLKTGEVQALTADNLTTVFIVPAFDYYVGNNPNSPNDAEEVQPYNTLTVKDGVAYQLGTVVGWNPYSYAGALRAINLKDGSIKWAHYLKDTGYYWSGMAFVNGYGVVGDDSGKIRTVNLITGKFVNEMQLPAKNGQQVAIRSSMNHRAGTDYVYFASREDAALNRVTITTDGKITDHKSVSFTDGQSTSTPTILDGTVYVGGSRKKTDPHSYDIPGIIAAIDADTMAVKKTYNLANECKSAPLAIKDSKGQKYVFFTCNGNPGAIFGIKEGEDSVKQIYVPDSLYQNYCMASVSVDEKGTLYYSNDSGTFFAVRLVEKPAVVPTTVKPTTSVTTTSVTTVVIPTTTVARPVKTTTTAKKLILITTAARKTQPTNAHTPATGEQNNTTLAIIFLIIAAAGAGSFVLQSSQKRER